MATPNEPTAVLAQAGSLKATISWGLPTDAGDSEIESYTVTALDLADPARGGQSATVATSPAELTGLAAGDTYQFTVVATNASGSGPAATSDPISIFAARVPEPPVSVNATAGNGEASITFLPNNDDGGAPVTRFKVTAIDQINPGNGNQQVTGDQSPIVVPGLTNGDPYTFVVQAANSVGLSQASAPSNPVTPKPPAPEDDMVPPYTGAVFYPTAKTIGLMQFADELIEASGDSSVLVSGYTPEVGGGSAGVWVFPGTIPGDLVRQVIDDHNMDPHYGQTDSNRAFLDVVQKVVDDPTQDLTSDEIQTAVKGLLYRSTMPS